MSNEIFNLHVLKTDKSLLTNVYGTLSELKQKLHYIKKSYDPTAVYEYTLMMNNKNIKKGFVDILVYIDSIINVPVLPVYNLVVTGGGYAVESVNIEHIHDVLGDINDNTNVKLWSGKTMIIDGTVATVKDFIGKSLNLPEVQVEKVEIPNVIQVDVFTELSKIQNLAQGTENYDKIKEIVTVLKYVMKK